MYMFPPFPLFSKVIQKLRASQDGKTNLLAPWWPSQPWFTILVCGPLSHHSISLRSAVTSRMESRTTCTHGGSHAALQAAGFSGEVSRLATAPRRPSTNCMYDNRWPRFAHWATGQGIGPRMLPERLSNSHFSVPHL